LRSETVAGRDPRGRPSAAHGPSVRSCQERIRHEPLLDTRRAAGALTLAVVARVKKRMTTEHFLTRAAWLARPARPRSVRHPPRERPSLDPARRPRTAAHFSSVPQAPPDLPRGRARS